MDVREAIKRLMKIKHLNQESLATSGGVTPGAISQFMAGGGIKAETLASICESNDVKILDFIANGGKARDFDPSDYRNNALSFIQNAATPEDLKELKQSIIQKQDWQDLTSTWEVRERALDPEVECTKALREMAQREDMWLAFKPTPEEVSIAESMGRGRRKSKRSSGYKSAEDYLSTLITIRSDLDK